MESLLPIILEPKCGIYGNLRVVHYKQRVKEQSLEENVPLWHVHFPMR